MERTLAIIKPDGVAQGVMGEVVRRVEADKLRVVAAKLISLSRDQAEGFYHVHRERPFFSTLVDFMTSGPVLVMVLEGEGAIGRWRSLLGATNPSDAAPGSIRADFASSVEKNIAHGSDAPETAAFETGYFFNALEVQAIDEEKVRKSGSGEA